MQVGLPNNIWSGGNEYVESLPESSSSEDLESVVADRHLSQSPIIQETSYKKYLKLVSGVEKENYYDASEETKGYVTTPDSGIHDLSNMDTELRAKMEEEWKEELAKTEEEIITLRQVLASKVRYAQDLKHKLGITVWKEFKEDMQQGIKNIQETEVYQLTTQTLKTAGEKTTNVLGNLGANVTKKIEDVK
ncbi:tumor protein D52-like isoform X1 [Limulus polyphemus]|uniref:Tumor protein D52-like isoform X1 n=1 Tax=Limulus polyphemus TaxID=6850 RepID=A0ABM1SFY3_LIMPO|nr:tumor protein D52-like isoform X1 [Limulus polyphemus]